MFTISNGTLKTPRDKFLFLRNTKITALTFVGAVFSFLHSYFRASSSNTAQPKSEWKPFFGRSKPLPYGIGGYLKTQNFVLRSEGQRQNVVEARKGECFSCQTLQGKWTIKVSSRFILPQIRKFYKKQRYLFTFL